MTSKSIHATRTPQDAYVSLTSKISHSLSISFNLFSIIPLHTSKNFPNLRSWNNSILIWTTWHPWAWRALLFNQKQISPWISSHSYHLSHVGSRYLSYADIRTLTQEQYKTTFYCLPNPVLHMDGSWGWSNLRFVLNIPSHFSPKGICDIVFSAAIHRLEF